MSIERNGLRRPLLFILTSTWLGIAATATHAASPLPEGDRTSQEPAADLPTGPILAEANAQPLTAPAAPAVTPKAPSQNVTINLIRRMVQKGLLTEEDAADLIKQAETDADQARMFSNATQMAAEQAAAAAQLAAIQAAAAAQATPGLAPSNDEIQVTYIPESVKAQLREEIKHEVMGKAREERWAAPGLFPEWTSRIKLFGDIRTRYEGDFFPSGNDNTGAFPNFNAINTGAPFNVAGTQFSPQLNVDQDRERFRLRARFGVDADLGEGFTAGLRIGTGETNSPVTANQTLGVANQGQGGNFSRYAVWLDRGFLKYEIGGLPSKDLSISVGRFDNPFFSTSIIWEGDLGFDGVALQARHTVAPGFTPFVNGGAFPVFNTDFNFSSNRPDKFPSTDKYLYGGQLGFDWAINKDFNLKLGGAYYYFQNIEGRLSDPLVPLTAQDAGNTDDTRPAFAQKGNTYMALRNIIPTVDNDFGTTNQFQYFGLATPFRDVALTGRLEYNHFEPFQISLTGEYIKNVAFDRASIDAIAVNNRGANGVDGSVGTFAGGDTAWIVGLKVGDAVLDKRWAWQVGLNYRNVESDSVVDGFNDSDFGGGGTNVKGYTLFGAVALSQRVNMGLRWMSADQIAGPPLKSDILQVDINGKF